MFPIVPYDLTVFSPEHTAAEIEGRVPVPVIVELVPVRILFKSEVARTQLNMLIARRVTQRLRFRDSRSSAGLFVTPVERSLTRRSIGCGMNRLFLADWFVNDKNLHVSIVGFFLARWEFSAAIKEKKYGHYGCSAMGRLKEWLKCEIISVEHLFLKFLLFVN